MTCFIFYTYMAALSFSLLAGMARFNSLEKADKIICFLLLITVLNELVCRFLSVRFRNDMIAWHVYSPAEFFVLCCYFNEAVRRFRSSNAGLWIGFTGLLLSLLSTFFIQPPLSLNSAFLLLEALAVFSLSLVLLYQMLRDETAAIRTSPRFRVAAALMLWSAFALIQWGMFDLLSVDISSHKPALYLLWLFNLAFYLNLFTLFLLYPKMIHSDE